MLIRAAEPQPREYLCCLSSLYTPLVYRLGKYPVAQTVEKQQDPRLNILFCCGIGLKLHRYPRVAVFTILAHMAYAREGQVHAGNQYLIGCRLLHYAVPGFHGRVLIHIKGHGSVWPGKLHRMHMYHIAPDQEAFAL